MNIETNQYDAIIVYSKSDANSADDKQYVEKFPFSLHKKNKLYNACYSYFLSSCKKIGIKAAFSTSKDIIGSGLFKSFWTFNQKWIKNCSKAHSKLLFDKFTSVNLKNKNKLNLLISSKSTYLFNNQKITDIFQNKLNTFNQLKEFSIPTVEITKLSKKEILLAKNKLDILLKTHKHNVDFNNNYIIKDKTGIGGFNIFKVNFNNFDFKKNLKLFQLGVKNKKPSSYIIQPFIKCNKGFVFGTYTGLIDLRIIILNNKIIQTYIRIAKKGSFKCNEQQGGELVYLPLNIIPKNVLIMTKNIIKKLNTKLNLKHALFSLDFIQSNNNNLFLIEGNDRPGIDWNPKKKTNEVKSKELIDHIVNELSLIIQEKNINTTLN